MNPSSSKLRLAVAAVASLILVAGSVAVTSSNDADPAASGSKGASSKHGRGSSASRDGGSRSSQASRDGGSVDPRTVKPPANADDASGGIYTFTVKITGTNGTKTSALRMRIEPPFPRGDGRLQRYVTLGGSDSYSAITEEWRADGLRLIRFEAKTANGQEHSCDFSPPANTLLRFPLAVGATWETTWPQCGVRSTVATVLRREQLQIGGVAVDTFVVRSSLTNLGVTETWTSWYSPAWHLFVKRVITVKFPTSTQTNTATLKSLLPS